MICANCLGSGAATLLLIPLHITKVELTKPNWHPKTRDWQPKASAKLCELVGKAHGWKRKASLTKHGALQRAQMGIQMIKYIVALGLMTAGCATAASAQTGTLPSADITARQLGAMMATVQIWGPACNLSDADHQVVVYSVQRSAEVSGVTMEAVSRYSRDMENKWASVWTHRVDFKSDAWRRATNELGFCSKVENVLSIAYKTLKIIEGR